MINTMQRSKGKNFAGIRLLQASYHNRSLALYASLGFETREPISTCKENLFKPPPLEELYVPQL